MASDRSPPDAPGVHSLASAPEAGPAETPLASHLGFVAHEIRNPMSTALWTAELLARMSSEERAGPRGLKLSTLCLRSVTRVRLLVEDHLLCQRLDAGGYPLRSEVVALGEVIEAALARGPAEPAPVKLELDPGLSVLADRVLLERALEGLAGVAARDAAVVRIGARRRGQAVEIQVEGGPVASLEDPAKGTPSDQRGRSLALAMARRVAAALGGSLSVTGGGYLLAIPAA